MITVKLGARIRDGLPIISSAESKPVGGAAVAVLLQYTGVFLLILKSGDKRKMLLMGQSTSRMDLVDWDITKLVLQILESYLGLAE